MEELSSPEALRAALTAAEEKLARWESFYATLRHDIRGALSPALLMADRLAMSADEKQKRAGGMISTSIDRAATMLLRRVDDKLEESTHNSSE